MALIKVMEEASSGATHKAVDGTLVDVINPLALPGDTTSALLKQGVAAAVGWFGRGYRDNKKFSF